MHDAKNLLCIVPPYFTSGAPPLGPAALLAYLRANGHDDFDFLDLRLWVPNAYAPTYRATGVFGETYVMDVPDLPLILGILANADKQQAPLPIFDENFNRFCLERAINAAQLRDYFVSIDRFLSGSLAQLQNLEFIGFSCWSSNFHSTLMAAAYLKQRKNPPLIVLGGPQTTESEASAKLALRSGLVDFVALGEGEETLLKLYEAFKQAKGIPDTTLPGTMRYKAESNTFETAERPLLRLPDLPLPAFDKMALMAYQRRHASDRVITYELSRGCTDRCVFCSEWVFWEKIRVSKISQVVDGMLQLQKDYNCDVIWFMDSLLNANVNRLRQLADEILKREVKIKWGGYMRANVDPETAKVLKASGCEFAFVGVESLSDETLELMRKRRSGADNLDALRALLDGGIDRVVAGFIPGFPGDTRERFTSTAMMLGDIHDEYPGRFRVNIEPFTTSPMQPMYKQMTNYGLIPGGWSSQYLTIAPQYKEITKAIYCAVDGPNQGVDRMGEVRVAQAITGAPPVEPDPFLYYEGEKVSTSALLISDIRDGWSMALMKTDTALMYGLILSPEEREQYDRFDKLETVGYGYGYGRKPQSSLFDREPFASYFEQVIASHLIKPTRDKPTLIAGQFLRQAPGDSDLIMLSPFIIARPAKLDDEHTLLLVDIVCNKSHCLDIKWQYLFSLLADGPIEYALIGPMASQRYPELAEQIQQLLNLGVLWASPELMPVSAVDTDKEGIETLIPSIG